MRPTVFLFDIDGTILLTGGAGRRAFEHAFAQVCGSRDACAAFTFGGMTDRAIARRGLETIGSVPSVELIDSLVVAYLTQLEVELARCTYQILPGILEALDLLGRRAHVAIGLGTGNVRAGAALKLARGGLWDAFAFGGFGCDHEDRALLLGRGAARGAAQLGEAVERCRVLVIGDTPLDVRAAHAIGADCLAVATGSYAAADLEAEGAALTVPNLCDARARAYLTGY